MHLTRRIILPRTRTMTCPEARIWAQWTSSHQQKGLCSELCYLKLRIQCAWGKPWVCAGLSYYGLPILGTNHKTEPLIQPLPTNSLQWTWTLTIIVAGRAGFLAPNRPLSLETRTGFCPLSRSSWPYRPLRSLKLPWANRWLCFHLRTIVTTLQPLDCLPRLSDLV